MTEFFAMGGYAVYIWTSYGLAALILVGLLLASIRSLRANEQVLTALEAAQGERRRRRARTAAPAQEAAP
ncbi:heme exporter protein CcmD [Indioceanicola profundi]|uniref:heme exporter protein CcmD n=1 Tax=Indioceanicola profundi TaxID=2220096 RepID=UPI000E6AD241|nr:heme exporter protein CcmD [Indioceanicola profundi]